MHDEETQQQQQKGDDSALVLVASWVVAACLAMNGNTAFACLVLLLGAWAA